MTMQRSAGTLSHRRLVARQGVPTRRLCRSLATHTHTKGNVGGANPSASDWAQRLLNVADSKKEQKAPAFDYSGALDNSDEEDEDMKPEKRYPAEARCFDTASIHVRSGDGGDGCVAFRREKFVAKGGPAGGSGGRGGNVWAMADPGLNSLTCFRHKVHWRAGNGQAGQGSERNGAVAEDLIVKVPLGTIIRRRNVGEDDPPLAELVKPGEKALLAVGGRGGRGNASFKTQKNNAPTLAEKGEKGSENWLDLELKVVADVGIIGVPNAGKSTFLSKVTAATPKIANYPFTTITPNLGVCELDYDTTVLADIPGLLEGAHEGLGLGHDFLRHIQRCRVLIHLIDGTSQDPIGDFHAINLELELFNPELASKPQIIAYNKMDLESSSDYWELVQESLLEFGISKENLFAISAQTGNGVVPVIRRVREELALLPPTSTLYETQAVNAQQVPRGLSAARIDDFTIVVEESDGPGRYFIVEGDALKRFAQMTNWDYYEAMKRFQHVLKVAGIDGALKAKGVKPGDTVVIGSTEFEWSDDQSDPAMYSAWLADMRSRGKPPKGTSAWPRPAEV